MARVDVYFITGLILFALGILVNASVPIFYYFIPISSFILGIITLHKGK